MATSTFDRPLVLTEKGVDNLIALAEKWDKNPPKPDGIKPYPDEQLEKSKKIMNEYFLRKNRK